MTSSGTTAESARSIACQIDGIDTCILNMLEKDGRATLAQLSEATGLSVSAVQSRVQKLERRGVISGYKAIIDDEKRGLPVSAYIAVTPTDYACESEIPGKLHDVDGIMSCGFGSGRARIKLTGGGGKPNKLG